MTKVDIGHRREQQLIHILFFLFGFGIMAWVPRFPEVRANLGLDNGAFGSLMSTGSIGAFFGLLTTGHIIHRIGVKRVIVVSLIVLFTSLISLVHVSSALSFFIFSLGFGFGITAIHVSFNSQAFHFNDRSGQNIVTSSAGYWSAGALSTAIASGFLVHRVTLATHITVLASVLAVTMIAIVLKLHPVLLTANKDVETEYSIKQIFTSFHIDWPVSLAMACVIYLEFAVGDWGTIFTKDRLGVSAGLSAIPYIVFTATMIFGRLTVQRLLPYEPLEVWAKRAAILGGAGFAGSIIIATHLPAEMKWWSYSLFIVGFFIGGLGSSFLGPSVFRAATRRSKLPSAIVVGQFGVVNNIIVFIIKWIVAWTMQLTGSIALAMMIPAAMLLSSVFFLHVLNEDQEAKS
ncbi:MAG: MFS transporter [Candidatus Planktophila sp.]